MAIIKVMWISYILLIILLALTTKSKQVPFFRIPVFLNKIFWWEPNFVLTNFWFKLKEQNSQVSL